jgi:signal transduction histidine kinase
LERSVRLQKRAEDLVRFKTDLLNMASHDLKTPLTAMLMQLQILQLGEPLDETRQKAVRILQRNTHRLRLMLDDMLDLARMESGTFVLRRVEIDVAHVVREACEIFGPKASNAGINFQENSEEGLIVKGDEHRLAQVLANLLSNAVRATSPGGQIRILAGSTGNKAEIVVEDSGCGMSKEQLARLFKPFERIGDYPSHRGTGLGLYLSRTVVEQHGGTITVSSPGLGKGTTLRVALPLDKQQKPEHRPPRTRPLGKPGVRGADGEREKPEALAHSNSEGPRRRRHQRTR